MIRLAITRAAYAAIQETLPESAALQPAEQNLTGKIFDFSDGILRLATLEEETGQNLRCSCC